MNEYIKAQVQLAEGGVLKDIDVKKALVDKKKVTPDTLNRVFEKVIDKYLVENYVEEVKVKKVIRKKKD